MKQRSRLTAAAFPAKGDDRGIGVVRTHENAREPHAPRGVAALDFGVHGVHLLPGQQATRETGLVRDDEESRSLPRKRAQALRRARREPHVPGVSEKTALDDERPVAIEEEGVEPAARQEPGPSALRTASVNAASV